MSLATELSASVPSFVRQRGDALFKGGYVQIYEGGPRELGAEVEGSELYDVSLRRERDSIYAFCGCPYWETTGICKHVWAAVLAADAKRYVRGINGSPARRLVQDRDADKPEPVANGNGKAFAVQRPPRAVPPPPPKWKTLLAQIDMAKRAEPLQTERELYYLVEPPTQWGDLRLQIHYRERRKDGEWGKLKSSGIARSVVAQLAPADRDLLAMLGGAPQTWDSRGDSVPTAFRMSDALSPLLLEKACATGRCRLAAERDAPLEKLVPLSWDDGPLWDFKLRLEPDGGGWVLKGAFERSGEQIRPEEPLLVHPEGLFLARGVFARYARGSHRWVNLLRKNAPIKVPTKDAQEFLLHMLNEPDLPRVDWPEGLRFEEIASEPRPHLRIEEPNNGRQKAETLCAYTTFDYHGRLVRGLDERAGVFDAENRVLVRRDRSREQAYFAQLKSLGFKLENGPYNSESHHHLASKKLPKALGSLVASGWQIALQGRAFRKPVAHRAELTSGIDWFELRAAVDYGPAQAQLPDLLKALQQKSSIVQLSDGSWGMIPEDLIEQYGPLIGAGRVEKDHLRYTRSQTALLDALLATRPTVNVDETFNQARERLRGFERISPAAQPEGFSGELRDYQREGLAWMLFLQNLGFGGCLADDMGLGKTAQVLALLEARRQQRELGNPVAPSLAVVPRSIVFNWKQEASRFAPALRVLDHTGIDRARNGADFTTSDLILTTYGTLRRDITALKDLEFEYVILDEAQAIKNGDSDTAKAARLLRARHRLAMSGTPIENHLGELFSLFEFLNPGMLGSSRSGARYSLNVRNPDEAARGILAAAVRPFILRRTKDQVARELPDRTEQTVYCELEAAERSLYNELREHYRQALLQRVEQQGIARSQIQILEALLRLRQAACHPGLLDAKRRENGSAKLEVLDARLSEVLSEGHKALVFSQFTSLLGILRGHLDRDGVVYEYLDGSTRDRQACVERFQTDPACRLFLISLKAGGVGLNLTAAEYVFLLDPWWNPAVEAQAIDRTHRIGQSNHVFAYRLIARDTVEEKVLALQAHKRELAESIIRADASLVRDLKREDLEFLLS